MKTKTTKGGANKRPKKDEMLFTDSSCMAMEMDEIAEITDYIQEEAGSTADVIWGHGKDEETMCAEYKVSWVEVQKISNEFK